MSIFTSAKREMARAEAKHPVWPWDLLHQVMIVSEEMGEVQQAALNLVEYNATGSTLPETVTHLEDLIDAEMTQVAAMTLRFLYHRRAMRGRAEGKPLPGWDQFHYLDEEEMT